MIVLTEHLDYEQRCEVAFLLYMTTFASNQTAKTTHK